MYCILNVHHDGAGIAPKSWIEKAGEGAAEEAEVKAKYTALWRQIALQFNTINNISDERNGRLVFEGMNEPQFDKLWPRNSSNVTNKTRAFRLLTDLNQIFVNTVRTTGGNNATRFLLIPSYWTDIDMNVNNWDTFFFMPTDTAQNKLILSFHYYTPWDFCGGDSITWTNTSGLNTQFNKVRDNILSKGIPVIIGEYGVNINIDDGRVGATPKNSAHRLNWMLGVTQKCVDLGICPVLWDTGMRGTNKGMADVERASPFGISDNLRDMINGVVWPGN
jgi:endoglucanase